MKQNEKDDSQRSQKEQANAETEKPTFFGVPQDLVNAMAKSVANTQVEFTSASAVRPKLPKRDSKLIGATAFEVAVLAHQICPAGHDPAKYYHEAIVRLCQAAQALKQSEEAVGAFLWGTKFQPSRLFTFQQAAEIVGVSVRTIRDYQKNLQMPKGFSADDWYSANPAQPALTSEHVEYMKKECRRRATKRGKAGRRAQDKTFVKNFLAQNCSK